ncbi:MAG: DUF58 domain-containing protein [Proteobacteria bacterium]|nr:MAG: DUF58 domain-containing protein [Pseudomonadota bacterium]
MMPVSASKIVDAAPAGRGGTDPSARSRVEPQLKDLMALIRPASLLPSWARSIRANQSGGYLSALKGRGMEYDESRPYQVGDDIRTLDWRVTARTGRPHTKLFREERERPVYVCTVFAASMFFATRGVFKSVQAARAAALIAWKAQQSGDRVGGLVLSLNSHHELPPERGKPAVSRLLKKMVEAGRLPADGSPFAGSGTLAAAAARLKRLAKPGSLVFIISDFRELDEALESDLVHLSRHCDLTLLFVYDPFEAALPTAATQARVTDGRTDITIKFGDEKSSRLYVEHFNDRYGRIAKLCRDYRILQGKLATTDDPLAVVQRTLAL